MSAKAKPKMAIHLLPGSPGCSLKRGGSFIHKYLLGIPTMSQFLDILLGTENTIMNHSATAPVLRVYALEEERDKGQLRQTNTSYNYSV